MAQCNWDPKKHGGRPCPVHGGGGLWDENIFARNEKLKKAGYTKEDLADVDEEFDEDYDSVFEEAIEKIGDGQINAENIAKASGGKISEEQARQKIEQEGELEDYPMGESEEDKYEDIPGASADFQKQTNEKYNKAVDVLKQANKPVPQNGEEAEQMWDNLFKEYDKEPIKNNDVWNQKYQALSDAYDDIFTKFATDEWVKNHRK